MTETPLRPLYPPIEPYRTGFLPERNGHRVYFEACGNPEGKPALFVHGGPGGGCEPSHRRFWDPRRYHIILFDQRGCGRSTPHACLEANTTWDLVEDMERLRTLFEVTRWQIFGGSWGSTLGLAYAQAHPDRVTELVLRGIFLCRPEEIAWFYQEGTSRIFPDAWEAYLAPIPLSERHDLVRAYHARLTSDDPEVRLPAARAWSIWEGSTCRLLVDVAAVKACADPTFAEAFARIESHYFVNDAFMDRPDQLLRGVEAIRHLPATIVHGRYDVICPVATAWELHRAWPEAQLDIVRDAGHSAFEPGIRSALVEATDRYAKD